MRKDSWNWVKERYNEIAPHVFDRVAGWSSIVGLILTILSIVNPKWFFDFWSQWFADKWEVVTIIAMAFAIIFFLLMAMKYRNSVIIKMTALSRGFSYVMEQTTNTIEMMENIECEISMQDQRCEDCSVRNSSIMLLLNKQLVNYSNAVLNMLSKTFSEHVSYPVSTCIKLVLPASGEIDINERCVITLARDENSDEQRERKMNPVPISNNSDFLNIITSSSKGNGGASFFYSSDLNKYSKDLKELTDGEYKYLNSSPDWQKYYVATMVVPIGQVIHGPNGKKYNVWAFLCADSLSTKAFTKRQKSINIKLMKSFSGMISSVFKAYYDKSNKYLSERGIKNA